jgi:small-conductance mechanosensitive channel
MQHWLDLVFFGNSVRDYLVTAGIILAIFLILKIFKSVVIRRLKQWSEKTSGTLDDFIVRQLERLAVPLVYAISPYIALQYLSFGETVERIVHSVFIILVTFFTARFIIATAHYVLQSYAKKHQAGGSTQSIKGISGFLSILVWVLSVVFLLDNLGFKVSTIVAGLGIGGIAVALAAQTILGDLFSYFVIFFDRPFQVGDFIMVDSKLGAVEHVGIKTTRIKSLGGEEMVFSNKDLTDSRIHNFKKMERRRVVFTIGVTYQTTLEKVKEIPLILKKIIVDQKNATFDRAHFKEYGPFSLNFEAVYYVIGADFNQYMDIQQSINLTIYEEFSSRKIEFAYPTQTLFVQAESKTAVD